MGECWVRTGKETGENDAPARHLLELLGEAREPEGHGVARNVAVGVVCACAGRLFVDP